MPLPPFWMAAAGRRGRVTVTKVVRSSSTTPNAIRGARSSRPAPDYSAHRTGGLLLAAAVQSSMLGGSWAVAPVAASCRPEASVR